MSASLAQRSFSVCVVCLFFFFSSFLCTCWKCLCLSLSPACSADKFLSLRRSECSTGILKQCLFKQRVWKVVMIYSIIPVETQELMCLHDSSISSFHYMATDRLMPDATSLLTYVVLICSILWLVVIRCLWLPVAILLFGSYQAFFVVFYCQLWLFVLCSL